MASALLVGDIGGTNTRLALYRPRAKRPLYEKIYPSQAHATFEQIALAFLATSPEHPDFGVLGVAGPVQAGSAAVTNLPWKLEEKSLARKLGLKSLLLKNDLVVAARGCLHVPAEAKVTLTEGALSLRGKNAAVIAAGTGLGEARLVWGGDSHLVLASEGGHGDFAPRSALEIELWHFLSKTYPDHVSYERVVSGAGLGAIYDFFLSQGGREPPRVKRRLAEGDRNAGIAELGMARAFRPAAKAVDLFTSIYGAEAGNFALRELALGGVFLVGNIAKQIVLERRDIFLRAFRQKGRFTAFLSAVPVVVVTDPLVGVRGALAFAEELTHEKAIPEGLANGSTGAKRPPRAGSNQGKASRSRTQTTRPRAR